MENNSKNWWWSAEWYNHFAGSVVRPSRVEDASGHLVTQQFQPHVPRETCERMFTVEYFLGVR